MKTLAIDCSTEACSIALFDAGGLVAHDHRILGRGHAEQLVPMIEALPGHGRAWRILVALGPGSFTGIRIGIATARALGLVWRSEVLGYPTLALVAAMAIEQQGSQPVDVAMQGGHGEWFVQPFGAGGAPEKDVRSLDPEVAARDSQAELIAGTQAEALVSLRGSGTALPLHPDARFTPHIPQALLVSHLRPVYGRAPDAKTVAERRQA
ncbi:tRNA (adenosine(37)-N6)-threonylcarbamoyltransferase complex dimerization subunit type 1 TsaB [Erythrobacter litoralis]|uniref:Metal-dependent protease n=1 Tax=Erythrobacter litoralis (strain HTCC2594) TaxID=314225 RepID=Q2N955_ERYLH|nr:tRNA (adenosine(37)-N6)-threonylcarbamoyltransferase complex dimerization subunit type 1 TsaB [Erythrobacter litoralis]ABC63786.1 metal-dependent protease [Erythrobacter litoralis HTCC2594]